MMQLKSNPTKNLWSTILVLCVVQACQAHLMCYVCDNCAQIAAKTPMVACDESYFTASATPSPSVMTTTTAITTTVAAPTAEHFPTKSPTTEDRTMPPKDVVTTTPTTTTTTTTEIYTTEEVRTTTPRPTSPVEEITTIDTKSTESTTELSTNATTTTTTPTTMIITNTTEQPQPLMTSTPAQTQTPPTSTSTSTPTVGPSVASTTQATGSNADVATSTESRAATHTNITTNATQAGEEREFVLDARPPYIPSTEFRIRQVRHAPAVSYHCYRIQKSVNGSKITERGCSRVRAGGESVCEQVQANQPHVELTKCSTCTKSLCNGSSALQASLVALFVAVVAGLLHHK